MKVGDIVILKESHWLREQIPGYCEIVEIKKIPIMQYNISILTLDLINGRKTGVWVRESELIPIAEIRDEKINKILDE
jgi:hypothetical protein